MPTFRTELLRGKGTTMGIVVPEEVVAGLGKGKRQYDKRQAEREKTDRRERDW